MGERAKRTIRRAGTSDLAPLLELIAEYCDADAHVYDQAAARTGVERLLADDRDGVVLVVEIDGVVDGYAALTWGWSIESGGREAILDEIYVRERDRGHGRALADAAEQVCRDHGVRRIFLETELENDGARRLYTRLGYRTEPSIWMAKSLA